MHDGDWIWCLGDEFRGENRTCWNATPHTGNMTDIEKILESFFRRKIQLRRTGRL